MAVSANNAAFHARPMSVLGVPAQADIAETTRMTLNGPQTALTRIVPTGLFYRVGTH
jgi:hypothetical protein